MHKQHQDRSGYNLSCFEFSGCFIRFPSCGPGVTTPLASPTFSRERERTVLELSLLQFAHLHNISIPSGIVMQTSTDWFVPSPSFNGCSRLSVLYVQRTHPIWELRKVFFYMWQNKVLLKMSIIDTKRETCVFSHTECVRVIFGKNHPPHLKNVLKP